MSRLDYIVKEKVERFEKHLDGTPQAKIAALKDELEKAWLEIAIVKLENTKLQCLNDLSNDTKNDVVSKIVLPNVVDDKYIIKCKE